MNPSPQRNKRHYRRHGMDKTSNTTLHCENDATNGGNSGGNNDEKSGCDANKGVEGASNSTNTSFTTNKSLARNGTATSSFLASLPSRNRKKRRQASMFRSQKRGKNINSKCSVSSSTNTDNASSTSSTGASVESFGMTSSIAIATATTATAATATANKGNCSTNPTSRRAKQTDRNINMPLHTATSILDTTAKNGRGSDFSLRACETKLPRIKSKETIRDEKEYDLFVANVCSSLQSLSQSHLTNGNVHNNDSSLVFSPSESQSQIQEFLKEHHQSKFQTESDLNEIHTNNPKLPQPDKVETSSVSINSSNKRRKSNPNNIEPSNKHSEINTMNLTAQLQQLISSHISPQMQSLQRKLQEYKDENESLKYQHEEQKEEHIKSIRDLNHSHESRTKNQENECRSLQRQVHKLQNILKQKDAEMTNMREKVKNYSNNLKQYKDQMSTWLQKAGFRFGTDNTNSNKTYIMSKVVKWEVMPPPSILDVSLLGETYNEMNTVNVKSSGSKVEKDCESASKLESNSKENPKSAKKNNNVVVGYDQNTRQAALDFKSEKMNISNLKRTAISTDSMKKTLTNKKNEQCQKSSSSAEIFESKSPIGLTSSSKAFSIKKVNHVKTENDRPSPKKLNYGDGDHHHQQQQQQHIKFEVRIIDDDLISSDGEEETQKEISDTQEEGTNVSEVFDFSPAVCSKKNPILSKKDSTPRFVTPSPTKSNQNSESNSNKSSLKKNKGIKLKDELIVKKEEEFDDSPSFSSSDKKNIDFKKNVISGMKQTFQSNLRNQQYCAPAIEVRCKPKQSWAPIDPMLNASCARTAPEVKEISSDRQKDKFKYQQVVRGKKARQALRGHSCEECDNFIKAVCDHPGGDVFSENMFTRCSRHRSEYTPPKTPLDFWELDFIDERETKEKSGSGNNSQSQTFDEV